MKIFESIGSKDMVAAISSAASVDSLIEATYLEPAKHRPEHRHL
jgi:hypothetical protein